jgi:hypothetical protein
MDARPLELEVLEGESTEVRQTRPWMARQSLKAGTAYVLGMEIGGVLAQAVGSSVVMSADWELAGALFAPAMWWITGRSVETFSRHGKTP